MKIYTILLLFFMTLNLFPVYNIGDTVLPEDNLVWTDNYGYSSSIFNEIETQNKVVVIFWGGQG